MVMLTFNCPPSSKYSKDWDIRYASPSCNIPFIGISGTLREACTLVGAGFIPI